MFSRILGDRFNADVKAAVLETLAILLAKVRFIFRLYSNNENLPIWNSIAIWLFQLGGRDAETVPASAADDFPEVP